MLNEKEAEINKQYKDQDVIRGLMLKQLDEEKKAEEVTMDNVGDAPSGKKQRSRKGFTPEDEESYDA